MALNHDHWAQRQGIADLVTLAQSDVSSVWPEISSMPVAAARPVLADVLYSAGTQYGDAAAVMAAEHYEEQRRRHGIPGTFDPVLAEPADFNRYAALSNWGTQGLLEDDGDRAKWAVAQDKVFGGLQRTIADQHRGTITASAAGDPHARGWRRIGVGRTCDFCQMLIDRDTDPSKTKPYAWRPAAPKDPWDQAMADLRKADSVGAIEAAMKVLIGDQGQLLGFAGPNLDPEKLRPAMVTMADLYKKHPYVRADIGIGRNLDPQAYAESRGSRDPVSRMEVIGKVVDFSAAKFSTRYDLAEAVAFDVAKGHLHPGAIKDPGAYIAAHEFGHIIDFTGRGAPRFQSTFKRAVEEAAAADGISIPGAGAGDWLMSMTSGYGRDDRMNVEIVGEAFADVYTRGDKATNLSKVLVRHFTDRARKWATR